MNKKGFGNAIVIVFILVAALFAIGLKRCKESRQHYPEPTVNTIQGDWRHHKVIFTSHARCRMECRDISEDEVKFILANGMINESKSKEADAEAEGHCPAYALEGATKDGQHVRIVFGACEKITKVITAIDLEVDHACDCR